MKTIQQPNKIIFGMGSASEYLSEEKCLIITSQGAISRGWLDYIDSQNFKIFDEVEPNPSIKTAEKIISKFRNTSFDFVIGLGG